METTALKVCRQRFCVHGSSTELFRGCHDHDADADDVLTRAEEYNNISECGRSCEKIQKKLLQPLSGLKSEPRK
jgi:hypothetical protein